MDVWKIRPDVLAGGETVGYRDLVQTGGLLALGSVGCYRLDRRPCGLQGDTPKPPMTLLWKTVRRSRKVYGNMRSDLS